MATPKKPTDPAPEPKPPVAEGEIVVTGPKIPEPPPVPTPPAPFISPHEIGQMIREAQPIDSGEIVVTAPIPGEEDSTKKALAPLPVTPMPMTPLDNPVPEQPEPAGSSAGLGSPGTGNPGGGGSGTNTTTQASDYVPVLNAMLQGPAGISPIALEAQGPQQPALQPSADPKLMRAMLQRSFFPS